MEWWWLLLAVGVAVVIVGLRVLVLWMRYRRAGAMEVEPAEPGEPDEAIGFGYKMLWVAVKSEDAEAVVEALALREVEPANWERGMKAASALNHRVFVTPTVAGWTFVVGHGLPVVSVPEDAEPMRAWLERLSERFGEAQHFASHRVVSYYAWAKAEDGRLVRGFAMTEGEVLWNEGDLTDTERGLDVDLSEGGEGAFMQVGEKHVLQVARGWGLDPSGLAEMGLEASRGVVGEVDAQAMHGEE